VTQGVATLTDQLALWLKSGVRLTADSRSVGRGDVFVAYPGTAGDGRDYIDQAIAAGARGVLVEARGYVDREHGVPVVAIENLRRRYPGLADQAYGYPSRVLKLVGVTGTNGKTSVSTWIAQALDMLGWGCGLIGTVGAGRVHNLIETKNTTPDAAQVASYLAQFVAQGAKAAAMEVSSHALHQERVHGLHIRYGVFTNLTHDHLDYHGTLEAYADAKAKLFTMPSLEWAILNADDPASVIMRSSSKARVLTYGLQQHSVDVHAVDARAGRDGIALTVRTPWGTVVTAPRVVGQFNVSNVLAVIATLGAMGVLADDISRAVGAITPVRGRMQRINGSSAQGDRPLVVVDYAHTPDALEKALKTVREMTADGRVILVFGCGGNRDARKRSVMGHLAAQGADHAWVTNDNPRFEPAQEIANQILVGMADRTRVTVELDRAAAIRRAIAQAGARDTVLIAGKGHEIYQEIEGHSYDFDDAQHASEALCSR
jgi:UDP-N-acetylmuramoyl-L-alanyl-D-glutamate--2,6-diaminopimelate ligase